MRNKNKKILIIALMTTLIFGGLSSTLFATARLPDPPEPNPKLHIQLVWPPENLEGYMTFLVYVVNDSLEDVEGATVHVETQGGSDSFPTRLTNDLGVAVWDDVYKVVDETTIYRVWATKVGYDFDGEYGYYTVTNKALHFVVLDRRMDEQTSQLVRVKDQYNVPIACLVYFQGIPYPTGPNGYGLIYAFDVTAWNVFENPLVPVDIEAWKSGYTKDTDVIDVEDLDNVETPLNCEVKEKYGPPDPIPDATVEVLFTKYPFQNTTDSNGECEIIFLPDTHSPKYYLLKASKPEYWSGYDWAIVPAGIPTNFDFELIQRTWSGPVIRLDITYSAYNEELEIHTFEFDAKTSLTETYSYFWDFGDGTYCDSFEGQMSHDYTSSGEYIIKVTAISPILTEHGEIILNIH